MDVREVVGDLCSDVNTKEAKVAEDIASDIDDEVEVLDTLVVKPSNA